MSEPLVPRLCVVIMKLFSAALLSTIWSVMLCAQTTAVDPSTAPPTPLAPGWVIAAGGKMAFDVASVRQNKSEANPVSNVKLNNARQAYAPNGGTFWARNYTLLDYIAFAYKLSEQQAYILLPSLPDWVVTDRFDIEAKSENLSPTKDQMRLMLQALLEDRFKLVPHAETRQLPVLAMIPAKPGKTGPHLKQHSADSPCPAIDLVSSITSAPIEAVLKSWPPNCRHSRDVRIPGGWRLAGRDLSMEEIADALNGEGQGRGNRVIVDQTRLTGTFDFVMDFTEELENPANENAGKIQQEVPLPTFQEAIADQLGLKLRKHKPRSALPCLL